MCRSLLDAPCHRDAQRAGAIALGREGARRPSPSRGLRSAPDSLSPPPVSGDDGQFNLKVTGLSISVGLQLGRDASGKPTVTASGCTTCISDVDVDAGYVAALPWPGLGAVCWSPSPRGHRSAAFAWSWLAASSSWPGSCWPPPTRLPLERLEGARG